MTKIYCDSPIHKVSSLALAFIFLAFCVLPVFASADEVVPSPSPTPIRPNTPIGYQDGDTFRDIMLVVLDSWGISFTRSDPDDDTPLLSLFDNLFEEFLDVTNQMAYEFWDDVQYGADAFGNLILDFTGINQIRQFANWLVDQYSLTDNTSTSTDSSVSWLLIPVGSNYSTGVVISRTMYMWAHQANTYAAHIGDTIIYASPNTANQWNAGWFRTPNGTTLYDFTGRDSATGLWYGSYNPFNLSGETGWLIPEFPTMEAFLYALNQYLYPSSSNQINLTINTTTINIPSDTDVSPDDGLQIEVPGTNWGDSIYTILNIIERLIGLYDSTQLNINTVIELISTLLQGLQKSVSVENIPGAVTLDYDDYDISLETDWSIVEGFYSDSEDSPFSALTAIIYGFPAPLILFFSVIVIFIIAYGFIRMGRDSH